MDWLILIWALFVSVVYIGGYFLPNQIGYLTTEFSKGYALILIASIVVSALHARAKASKSDSH